MVRIGRFLLRGGYQRRAVFSDDASLKTENRELKTEN
jgi:hypothetical protein